MLVGYVIIKKCCQLNNENDENLDISTYKITTGISIGEIIKLEYIACSL